MREIRTIVGLRVISMDEGANVGTVTQVVVDLAQGKLLGFLLGSGAAERGVRAEEIQTIGTDAIIISTRTVARHLSELPELEQFRRPPGAPLPQVFTTSGEHLGGVSSVYLDPLEKVVTRYEVSGGPVKDVTEGVLVLPVVPGTVHGVDALILPDQGVRKVGRETGGLFGRLSEFRGRLKTQYQHAAEGVEKLCEESADTLKKEAAVVSQSVGKLSEKARQVVTELKSEASTGEEAQPAEPAKAAEAAAPAGETEAEPAEKAKPKPRRTTKKQTDKEASADPEKPES